MALSLGLAPARLLAQQQPGVERPSIWSCLEKGTVEWGWAGNFGVAHDIWGGVPDGEFVSAGVRLGRVLTDSHGPGFLRGRLAIQLEIYPLWLMFQQRTSYAFSATLLGRHYLDVASEVRPFLSFGAGVLWSRDDIPPETTPFNFTPQVGLGLAFPDRAGRVYALEYRLHHISNASLAEENPGINSSFFQFSLSFFRPKRERAGSR